MIRFTVFINHIDSDLKKKINFWKIIVFIGFLQWVYRIQSGSGLVASFEKPLVMFTGFPLVLVKVSEVVPVDRSKTLVMSLNRGPHVNDTSENFYIILSVSLQDSFNGFTRFLHWVYIHFKAVDSWFGRKLRDWSLRQLVGS